MRTSERHAGNARPTLQHRLESEMTRLLYAAAGPGLVFHALVIAVTLVTVWGAFPPATVLGWLGVVGVVTAGRCWLQVAYHRHRPDPGRGPGRF